MRLLLAAGIVGGLLLAGLPFMVQSSGPAPAKYDLDGDGVISLLDVAMLSQHVYEHAETPPACARVEYFATPYQQLNAEGTVIGDSHYRIFVTGFPRDLSVCP